VDRLDLIVIGEGVAGLTAAREAAGAGLRVAMFEETLFGGLITNVNALDPSPYPATTMGADLAASLLQASIEAGAQNVQQQVTAVERARHGFAVRTAETGYEAAHLIIAAGARFRPLGIPGETAFLGRGVSHCADCDGPLHGRNAVVVAGGGDSALQEALVLAEHCARVHIVHHGTAFTGRADLAARLAGHANVTVIANAEIERIEGADGVERVVVKRLDDERRIDLPCKGVFPYVGLLPNTAFLPPDFERDASGYLVTDGTLETSVPGAFAVGAVRAGYGGLLDEAVRDGAVAARTVAARAAGRPKDAR
jgi:thioredoxin reductase (NADPH)